MSGLSAPGESMLNFPSAGIAMGETAVSKSCSDETMISLSDSRILLLSRLFVLLLNGAVRSELDSWSLTGVEATEMSSSSALSITMPIGDGRLDSNRLQCM